MSTEVLNKETLLKKFNEATYEYVKQGGQIESCAPDMYTRIYVLMFHEYPNKQSIYSSKRYLKEHCLSKTKSHLLVEEADKNTEKPSLTLCSNGELPPDGDTDENEIIISNTMINILKNIPEDEEYITIAVYEYPIIITSKKTMIFINYGDFNIYTSEIGLPEWFKQSLVYEERDCATYDYIMYDSREGFIPYPMDVKNLEDFNLEDNYNDDLPNEEILDFINSDESGLIILHGKPGTGKSTYIRNLICSLDKDFVYLDPSTFDSITDASFIKTMIDYENGVLILEDCESMLVHRTQGNNTLAALLNITDGILGDSFKFKVICTFNADIGKIDPALLRRGRLKVKYEFKELAEDKVAKLFEKLDIKATPKKMSVSDIYNFDEDVEKSKEKKIGFGK